MIVAKLTALVPSDSFQKTYHVFQASERLYYNNMSQKASPVSQTTESCKETTH